MLEPAKLCTFPGKTKMFVVTGIGFLTPTQPTPASPTLQVVDWTRLYFFVGGRKRRSAAKKKHSTVAGHHDISSSSAAAAAA